MENDDMGEFEFFYHSNNDKFRKIFGEEFAGDFQQYLDLKKFIYGICDKGTAEIQPRLHDLMLKHFPLLANASHPDMVDWLASVNETSASSLFWRCRKLISDNKDGTIPKNKYPKLEEWRELYVHPGTSTVEDSDRNMLIDKDDAEWEAHKAEENRILALLHEFKEERYNDYYNIVQPVLFNYLPELNDLEGDYWVLFAMVLRDNYDTWMCNHEDAESVFKYNLPEETIMLEGQEFIDTIMEECKKHFNEKEDGAFEAWARQRGESV